MRWLRVHLEDKGQPDFPMYVDIVVDADFYVRSGPIYCGWLGKFKSNECYPLILRPNSRGIYSLDFGEKPDWGLSTETERLANFRINEHKIRAGEIISYFNENEDGDLPNRIDFVIRSATDLLSGVDVLR